MRQVRPHFTHAGAMSHRSARVVLLLVGLAAILSALVAPYARASITLSRFEAIAQDAAIVVIWETQTELNTLGFRLYRAETASPASWGTAVTEVAATGGVVPASYSFVDANVQPNVLYWYRLEEVVSSGPAGSYGPVSAGIGLPAQATLTPTATATTASTTAPTSSPTLTRTQVPTITQTPTDAPLPPTATRQFENTATVPPTATATFGSAFNSGLPTPAPATPIGGGSVSTPTPGGAAVVPAPPPVMPSSTPTLFVPTVAAGLTGTPSAQASGSPTPFLSKTGVGTPGATRTPAVFEAVPVGSPDRQPTPESQGGSRNSTLAYMLGGGAIVFAVLLAATGTLLWRSRH